MANENGSGVSDPFFVRKIPGAAFLVAARPRRWGIGIQTGYGLAPRTGRWEPYIGIGIQYSLW